MSLRVLMAVGSFVILAIALAIAGLSSLLVPGFVLMVLTSYSTLLRNTLYAVQRLGFEAVAASLGGAPPPWRALIWTTTHSAVSPLSWGYAPPRTGPVTYLS